MKPGKVWLVGAGCGEADLITVRGAERLKCCDVVVYDDLIAPELLNLAPAAAEKIYMGKRSGAHSASQSEITDCLVRHAKAGKTVVRLKGGDPFVFGRGGEEMETLLKEGISCEVVPGISSAIAIPAEAGIPVTHRGVSRSVHIVTAHTADTPDGLPEGVEELACLPGTLVFLMGLKQLSRIAERLMAAGKAADTPAAVISGGNAPHPAVVRGTLGDIAERAKEVESPAVIVVGETAALKLRDESLCPLSGTVVGLTGTDAMADKLRPALTALGAQVFSAERTLVKDLQADLNFLRDGSHRWLVFTSSNGVHIFFNRLWQQGIDLRHLAHVSFAVVGPGTAAALAEHGIRADLCPAVYTTEALGRELIESVFSGEICLLRSAKGGPELYEMLSRWLPVWEVPLYDLRPDHETARLARPRLQEMDYLVFSSASGVELYFRTQGTLPEGTRCVCIGPVAARTLARYTERPPLMAESISAEGITAAILRDRAEKLI